MIVFFVAPIEIAITAADNPCAASRRNWGSRSIHTFRGVPMSEIEFLRAVTANNTAMIPIAAKDRVPRDRTGSVLSRRAQTGIAKLPR